MKRIRPARIGDRPIRKLARIGITPGVTRRAAHGDAKALKQFFSLAQDADGAAAESIWGIPTVVYHLLGDEKFAKFLLAQPLPYRMMVRNRILSDGLMPPASVYLSRHFPLTARALFQREIVDWFSPNGLYAIRKVFTDELELGGSKVERAELIEKKSGRVLLDLTRDDIGTGAQREGEALWSPDSKRVACLSSDLTVQRGNLFSTPRPAAAQETDCGLPALRRLIHSRRFTLKRSARARQRHGTGGRNSRPRIHRATPLAKAKRARPRETRILREAETLGVGCKVQIDTPLRSTLSNHCHHRLGWKGDTCLEAPQRPTMNAKGRDRVVSRMPLVCRVEAMLTRRLAQLSLTGLASCRPKFYASQRTLRG